MSQQINLFNPLFRKRGFEFTSANAMLCGLVVVIVIAALYGVYQDHRTREAASQAQEVARRHADATALRDKLVAQQAARKPNAALDNELIQLEWRLRGRQDIVDTLNSGVLGTTRGFADYLRAFSRQTVDGLWLTGFDIASSGNELLIQGRTLSADLVPSYLKRLHQEPALQGRRFAELRISQPKVDAAAPQREPVAKDEKKSDAGPRKVTAGKDEPPAQPRYLEFTLTSLALEAGQKTQPVSPSPVAAASASQQKDGGTEAAK